jgi:hypothetical protein
MYRGPKQMIEWKERTHETNDFASLEDSPSLEALRDYGLLNLFHCPLLGSHEYLLEKMV